MVGLAVFCFCHRSLEIEEYERISPQGTLVAAILLHRLCHSMKQDVANVSVHQHILRRAVQCPGFTSTPWMTGKTNPIGKFLGKGRKDASMCERQQESAVLVEEDNEAVRSLSLQMKISSWCRHILGPACFPLGALLPSIIITYIISSA